MVYYHREFYDVCNSLEIIKHSITLSDSTVINIFNVSHIFMMKSMSLAMTKKNLDYKGHP